MLGGATLLAKAQQTAASNAASTGLCVTVANHWSYIGIGWQLGLESCVLSVIDSLELADRPPGIKTCINLDARAYELLSERYPAVTERLKKYLSAGKVELVGGTYSQPMGTGISGESNIRQIVYGRETIRRCLGYEMTTFLEEEEFSHPQVPQILNGAGYKYASLSQVDTWGRAGVPEMELNVFRWKGIDGSTIPSLPNSPLPYRPPDLGRLASTSSEVIERLRRMGKPLLLAWEEFGWEPPESPRYLSAPKDYLAIPKEFPVEFVTLREYMEKYGRKPESTIYLDMDAWRKILFWGIGGDQLRVLGRKTEALLLAAETFDAVGSLLGATTRSALLEDAWKNLMTAQSHDVGLCEYSRGQGDRMPSIDRAEDFHNTAWGAIGYHHLDEAKKLGQSVLTQSVNDLAARVETRKGSRGHLAAIVFNSQGWSRTDIVRTGRIQFRERGKDLAIRDSGGRETLFQLVSAERDRDGDLISADVAFRAENVPGVGYDTYYIDVLPGPSKSANTDLRIDTERLELENTYVKLKLDPGHGALISLVDKSSGQNLLDASKSPFPAFKGFPNPAYPLTIWRKYRKNGPHVPEVFDSSISKASIQWIEQGPLRATVRATHTWPMCKFESLITLNAHSARVEIVSRVLPSVPPAVDPPSDRFGRLPLEIKGGYWLTMAPGFPPSHLRCDFPFGLDSTSHKSFGALTLLDMEGAQHGLLLLHSGTQYFKRDENGVIWNLLMREWESFWTGEFGWPRFAEYRHALLPHAPGYTAADCMRASADFSRELFPVVLDLRNGSLPSRKGFISIEPESVHLSAFRKHGQRDTELRLVQVGGPPVTADVKLDLPIQTVMETDLLGKRIDQRPSTGGRFSFRVDPWKIRTFRV
jgi:hypothetical protein